MSFFLPTTSKIKRKLKNHKFCHGMIFYDECHIVTYLLLLFISFFYPQEGVIFVRTTKIWYIYNIKSQNKLPTFTISVSFPYINKKRKVTKIFHICNTAKKECLYWMAYRYPLVIIVPLNMLGPQ
jgi:hypothetical protein